jgi:hypothetical protein
MTGPLEQPSSGPSSFVEALDDEYALQATFPQSRHQRLSGRWRRQLD